MTDGRVIVIGPSDTEYGPRCTSDTHRCQHFGIHDWHYTYCSARPKDGQTYPWKGAGTQTFTNDVTKNGCPFGTTSATKDTP